MKKFLSSVHKIERYKWLLIVVFFMLLVYRLGSLAFWGDEIGTIDVASKPLSQILRHLLVMDIHSPMYYIFIHFWMIPFGQSEFALRFPSIVFSILTLILMFFYFKKSKLGISSLLLFMSSPFIVMYSRMGRYYSLMMFFGVLSIISLLEFIKRPERRWKLLYCVSNILLLYTAYPGVILFVAENVYFLIKKKEKRVVGLSTWIFMQSIVVLLFLPWIYVLLFLHIGGNLTYLPLDFFLKLLYPLYSYSIGETIFPWEFFIALPTIVIFYFLFFKGMLRYPKYSFSFFILPLIIGASVLSTVFAQILFPFSSSRLIFLAPIAYTIVAVGIKETKFGNILLFLLICCNLYGLFNYYTVRHFHNQAYIVPWREIVETVEEEASDNSIVMTAEFPFQFYERTKLDTYLDVDKLDSLMGITKLDEVWFIIRYRGTYDIVEEYENRMQQILSEGYKMDREFGFMKQEAIIKRLKEKIIGVRCSEDYIKAVKFVKTDK